jgi:hypothetical protein
MTKPKIEEKEEIKIEEVLDETQSKEISNESSQIEYTEIDPNDLESIMPQMNVAVQTSAEQQQKEMLITDDEYLGVINGILTEIREDRKQVSDYIDNFADMVINDGDATTSTKEALVNLVKIKTDLQDKMLKAADLMTRLKLKNTYAFSGPHLNAMQQNNFNIGPEADFSRKELIKAINQAKKKKKE